MSDFIHKYLAFRKKSRKREKFSSIMITKAQDSSNDEND